MKQQKSWSYEYIDEDVMKWSLFNQARGIIFLPSHLVSCTGIGEGTLLLPHNHYWNKFTTSILGVLIYIHYVLRVHIH